MTTININFTTRILNMILFWVKIVTHINKILVFYKYVKQFCANESPLRWYSTKKTEEKLLHACCEEMGSFCVIFQRHHPALIPTLSFACSPFS